MQQACVLYRERYRSKRWFLPQQALVLRPALATQVSTPQALAISEASVCSNTNPCNCWWRGDRRRSPRWRSNHDCHRQCSEHHRSKRRSSGRLRSGVSQSVDVSAARSVWRIARCCSVGRCRRSERRCLKCYPNDASNVGTSQARRCGKQRHRQGAPAQQAVVPRASANRW